jgi:type I restriction enzyme M protein
MTSIQQRAELQRRIWQIANDVRGAVDGWDFKQYVLGAVFYRFISENFTAYIEGGDDGIDYARLGSRAALVKRCSTRILLRSEMEAPSRT